MNDDDPEAGPVALAASIRSAVEEDARWRALAEGRSTDEERVALAAEDPERFARWQPFDAAEDDALMGGLLAALGHAEGEGGGTGEGGGAGEGARSHPVEPESPPDAVPTPTTATVIRPPRWRRAVGIAIPLVLAAGLALFVMRPDPGSALPGYRVDDTSGDRATRTAEAIRTVGPDARLRWVLRPATPVESTVDARAFVIDDGRHLPLALTFETAPGGAIRLDVPVSEALPGRQGPISMLIVVGSTDAIAHVDKSGIDPASPPAQTRVVEHRMHIESTPRQR